MTRNEKQAELIKRFIDNLGDVKNWEHKGEVVELPTVSGTCVCGHPIKFLYYIEEKNTHRKEALGSECINNFKDYSPEMYEALMNSQKTYKENKKKEKDEKLEKEISILWLTLETKVITIKSLNMFYPPNIYNISMRKFGVASLKTLSGKKRKLEKLIAEADFFLESEKERVELAKVRKIIKERIKKDSKMEKAWVTKDKNLSDLDFLKAWDAGQIKVDKVYEYDILGKTYAIKEDLKANGFSWNGSNWTLMSTKEIDLSFLNGNKKIEIIKREF